MDYKRLGNSGLKVARICLGTMQFGWSADEKASYQVMDAYFDAGGNFLDTADIYSAWLPGQQRRGERGNHRALVKKRKTATCAWWPPNSMGACGKVPTGMG